MAKFKVGDKIKYGKLYCKVLDIKDGKYRLSVRDAHDANGKEVQMVSDINEIDSYSSKNSISNTSCSINSTRPIVQNALNSKACNAVYGEDGDEIRVGHDVMRADSSDGIQCTVTKIEGKKVYFKNPANGRVEWEMAEDLIAVNSCVAKNSDSSIRATCRGAIDSLKKLRVEVEKDYKSGILPKFYLDEVDACLKKIESVNYDFS